MSRYTVIFDKSDDHIKITSLLKDLETYEVLKGDPASSYKKKVIEHLEKLEKDHIIDRPTYYCLWPGEAKIHKKGAVLRPTS